MARRSVRIATIAAGALLAGCGSIATFESGRPLRGGAVQAALEPSWVYTRGGNGDSDQPYVGAVARVGLTDDVAVGARAGWGVRPELLGRFQLVHPDDSLVSVALGGGVGAWWTDDGRLDAATLYAQPALIVGLHPDWFVEPVVALKLDVTGGWSPRQRLWGVASTPCASLGVVVRPFSWFAVLPELSVGGPVAWAGTGGTVVDGFVAQAGVALLIGGEEGFGPW
jgi:hypothetical protein